jgi:hypothetical protein
MSKYTATSLEDIARMFDYLAQSARDAEPACPTQRAVVMTKGQAIAYADAADIIRNTDLRAPVTEAELGLCEKCGIDLVPCCPICTTLKPLHWQAAEQGYVLVKIDSPDKQEPER